jgi:hypothetical protein
MIKDNHPVSNGENQPEIFLALNFLLVSLMMACFAFILGRAYQWVIQDWQSTGFAVLAFFVALESLILRYSQRKQSKVLYNQLLYTFTEIIFIIIIVKMYSITLDPTTQIWIEIRSWSTSFFPSFFNVGTLLRLAGVFTIWSFSWLFSFPLNELKEDHDLLAQEILGHSFTDRYEARRGLIRLIFVIGFLMLLIMSMLNSGLILAPADVSTNYLLISLLIYFAASFMLLALNQYALMKARWYLNKIPVNKDLSKQWLLTSFVFILIVIAIIAFLPTGFTVGFRPIAGFLFNLLLIVLSIFQFLFSLPFALLSSGRNTPLESDALENITPQERPEFFPITNEPTPPIPWLEFIKSAFFWIIFLFVIGFSIYYFIKNKYGFEFFFKNFKIGIWLKSLWHWLKERVVVFSDTVTATVQKASEEIQVYFKRRSQDLRTMTNLIKTLPPRQTIIFNYLDWLRWNTKKGITREKSQTPYEFARTCAQINPQAVEPINSFTNLFISARYSKQKITRDHAQTSRKLLNQLKDSFQKTPSQPVPGP